MAWPTSFMFSSAAGWERTCLARSAATAIPPIAVARMTLKNAVVSIRLSFSDYCTALGSDCIRILYIQCRQPGMGLDEPSARADFFAHQGREYQIGPGG